MNTLLIAVAIFSIALSLFSKYYLLGSIFRDYKARKAAKARYEKDPNLDLLPEEFYVPTVTVGEVLVVTFLWIIPGVNLITFACSMSYLGYKEAKRVWNSPVIDW